MKLKKGNFNVDFQVNHGDKRNWNFSFFKDFACNDITLVKESKKPWKHSIKVIDEEELRFRSTFDIGTVSDLVKTIM
jgi:hypothetical protein